MKYENFEQAKSVYEAIEKHKRKLEELEGIEVVISRPSGSRVYTIGVDSMCEHEYTKHAKALVEAIKTDLTERVEVGKSMLALL